jgi:hypothetical protein
LLRDAAIIFQRHVPLPVAAVSNTFLPPNARVVAPTAFVIFHHILDETSLSAYRCPRFDHQSELENGRTIFHEM